MRAWCVIGMVSALSVWPAAFDASADTSASAGLPLARAWSETIGDVGPEFFMQGDILAFFDIEGGDVWAFGLEPRKLLWTHAGHGHSHPVPLRNGDLLLETSRDSVTRLRLRAGEPAWSRQINGSFSDETYAAVAGHLACLVYHGPTPTGEHRCPDSREVIDLDTGRPIPLASPLSANPLSLALESPPRLLFERPSLYLDDDWQDSSSELDYSVACRDAASGKKLWELSLGRISRTRTPAAKYAWGPLGLWAFSSDTGASQCTELWWLDLDRGRLLGSDNIPGRAQFGLPMWSSTTMTSWNSHDPPATIFPFLREESSVDARTAEALRASVHLLTLRNFTASISQAENLEKPLWTADLSPLLSGKIELDDHRWEAAIAWPSATLVCKGGAYDGPVYPAIVLLLDLERTTVYPVLEKDNGTASVCLDPIRALLYVMSEGVLAAYSLPRRESGSSPAAR